MNPNRCWCVWDEDDADSVPSDPLIGHCKEWFFGRWLVGEDEPRERIRIGDSQRDAEVARRIARHLNTVSL